jgi:hypothetical protein
VETLAFAGIVQQGINAIKIDQAITNLFQSIPGYRMKQGSRIFISLPYNWRQSSDWYEFQSLYYGPDPLILWTAYGIDLTTQRYDWRMRTPDNMRPKGLRKWLVNARQHTPVELIAPFYLDDKYRLWPISQFSLLAPDGHVAETFSTGLAGNVAPEAGKKMDIEREPDVNEKYEN